MFVSHFRLPSLSEGEGLLDQGLAWPSIALGFVTGLAHSGGTVKALTVLGALEEERAGTMGGLNPC